MTRSSFISEVRLEYDDWLKANNEILTKIFTWAMLIDESTIQVLKEINQQKKQTQLLKTMGNIPDFSQHTMKQRGIIIKWQKNMYRGDYLLSRSMRSLENVDLLKEINEIQSKNIDQNLKKFLMVNSSILIHNPLFFLYSQVCKFFVKSSSRWLLFQQINN